MGCKGITATNKSIKIKLRKPYLRSEKALGKTDDHLFRCIGLALGSIAEYMKKKKGDNN